MDTLKPNYLSNWNKETYDAFNSRPNKVKERLVH